MSSELSRGDSQGGVPPSSFGQLWCYVTCPGCGERVKPPFARLAGVTVNIHRSGASAPCRLVVVVAADLDEPRVVLVRDGTTLESVMQDECSRLYLDRLREAGL